MRQRTRRWTTLALAILTIVSSGPAIRPATAAPAVNTHQVEIDGSPLFTPGFLVQGVTGWLNGRQIQTVSLQENRQYYIQTGVSAVYGVFWGDAAGDIAYEPAAEPYFDGAGTPRLTLVGVQVTVDARYLSGIGLLLASSAVQEWISYRTIRLLPQPYLYWQQGSGIVVNFRTALRPDGTWSYDTRFDLDHNGYVRGNGTSTLTFYGYPLLVDARSAGGTGVLVHSVAGLQFTPSAVQTVVVLPTSRFYLQIASGPVVSDAPFALEDNGQITFDPSLPYRVDSFQGMRRLTVTGPL